MVFRDFVPLAPLLRELLLCGDFCVPTLPGGLLCLMCPVMCKNLQAVLAMNTPLLFLLRY